MELLTEEPLLTEETELLEEERLLSELDCEEDELLWLDEELLGIEQRLLWLLRLIRHRLWRKNRARRLPTSRTNSTALNPLRQNSSTNASHRCGGNAGTGSGRRHTLPEIVHVVRIISS
jgi:hypothetical protein